jgi:3-isopropylmalate/(R)-2-methylmalate dehydratase small subunit
MSSSVIHQLRGRAVPVRGNDIDTDRIIPARFMKTVSFDSLGQHVFHDVRWDPSGKPLGHPFDSPRYRGAGILLANRNFGCGSSREHAPQALAAWGIRAVVAESLAEIFAGNCTAIGIPVVQVEAEAAEALIRLAETRPETELVLDLEALRLQAGGQSFPLRMPESRRKVFLAGSWDTLGLLLEGRDQIQAAAARLPYIAEFPYPRG